MAKMKIDEFNKVVEEQIKSIKSTLVQKAKEYATDDRLHNFKVAAVIENCTPRQALMGMMAKHTVSVYDMAASLDEFPMALWNEKITDSINYLLLRALVEEQ
jgi:hypothetical protein